ncbi:hypothetical protein BX600DRAFT_554871 [Xylariales sp. PMI_506]|nr:hypothetical protein BX600DRAFT_554871 [Xylariales sp. PMI_506]
MEVIPSDCAAHEWGFPFDEYGLTKNSGTLAVQQAAKSVSPEDLQIVSLHPGTVYTAMSGAILKKEEGDWDSGSSQSAGFRMKTSNTDMRIDGIIDDLPAHFMVWAASTEAQFLHGRFVWANWDVNELTTGAIRERLDNDPDFLTIGTHGLVQDPNVRKGIGAMKKVIKQRQQ